MSRESLSRRDFLVSGGAAALLASMPACALTNKLGATRRTPPIGIELYALRTELARDLPNTLRQTKAMGYDIVEFYAPYTSWTPAYAKEVRTMMDDLGLKCHSTHNAFEYMITGAKMQKAVELNQIIGSRTMVLASPDIPAPGFGGQFGPGALSDEFKFICQELWLTVATLEPLGMKAGYHNHAEEWRAGSNGIRPMDYIAENTPPEFTLQFDVGTCVEAGADPVAWVNKHKGRIRSVHLKDWAPGSAKDEKGYRVLFGEGVCPWKPLIAALESVGGVEFYLMEQEGSRYSEFETAKRCLDTWKQMRANS